MKTKIGLTAAIFVLMIVPLLGQSGARGLSVIASTAGNEGKRWAVCIGIDDYYDDKIAKLKKARNDAKALGSVLKENGQFDYVFVMTDDLPPRDPLFPTKFNIEQKLRNIIDFASEKDLIVFSFSGHGISDKAGEGFLVSVDSRMDDKFDTAVRVGDIVGGFARNGITKSLLLLDACREEMQESKGLSNEGLREARFSEAEVAATFYATKSGMFSYEDKESDFGVFTRFVTEGLLGGADQNGDKIVSFNELEAYVQDKVTDWSIRNGRSQKPYTKIYGERYGDLALSVYDVAKRASLPSAAISLPSTAMKEPEPKKAWETIRIPGNLSREIGSLVDGKIYYIGGSDDNGTKAEKVPAIRVFDLGSKELTTALSIDSPATQFAVLELNGKIYYSGGLNGLVAIDEFHVYDPAANSVTALPKMTTKRKTHAMAAIGQKIYFLGGFQSLAMMYSSSVDCLDLSAGTWSKAKDMLSKRDWASAIGLDGKIYVFSGMGLKEGFASIEVYDPGTDSWRLSTASLPAPLAYMGMAELGGLVYLFGGVDVKAKSDSAVSNRIFAFDPKTEKLVELKASLPLALISLNCSAYGGKIYLWNGSYWDGKQYKRNYQVFIFDPTAQ